MSQRLACPTCKSDERLYSVERMIIEYPVTVTAEEGIDYTGEESKSFDETAEATGDIHCRACDWEGGQGDLTAIDDTTTAKD